MGAKTHVRWCLLACCLVGLAIETSGGSMAGDLTVVRFIDLTLARLELSHQAWTRTGRPPTPEETTALFATYGISEVDYLDYASIHHETIDAHLARHPTQKRRIDALSAGIRRAIAE